MTSSVSTGGDSTGSGVEPCSCRKEQEHQSCTYEALQDEIEGCNETILCPIVTVTCPRPNGDLYYCLPEYEYDEPALRCALEALRDRTPGVLRIDGTEDGGVTSGQRIRQIRVLEESEITSSCIYTEELGTEWSPGTRGVLAEPAHFEGCLELSEPAERYECLWSGVPSDALLPACP